MSKAAEAFRTIGEVADELDVPKHVLRFWEGKFPHIRPMKRGGGRRYYRPEDLELLRGIRHLLHAEGYTIKGVQKILREQGIDEVKRAAEAAVAIKAQPGKKRPRKDDAQTSAKNTAAHVHGAPAPSGGTNRQDPARAKAISAVILELETCRKILLSSSPRAEVIETGPQRLTQGRA